jgi:hypothetical protein
MISLCPDSVGGRCVDSGGVYGIVLGGRSRFAKAPEFQEAGGISS